MNCYHCGSANTKVFDSLPAGDGAMRRRRHICNECGERFTSVQIAVAERLQAGRYGQRVDENDIWSALISICMEKMTIPMLCDQIAAKANHES